MGPSYCIIWDEPQAHQISKLEGVPQLEGALKKMHEAVEQMEGANGLTDKRKAQAVLNEVKQRHDWVMNPNNAGFTNQTSALGFFWYLGATPAAALVNLTQTAIIGVPTLGARHGNVKAFNALNVALKDFTLGKGSVANYKNLKPAERKAFESFKASGVIDRTQVHNLAGIGDSDATMNSMGFNKAMSRVSWMFHNAEVLNREVTLLAAYRLARKAGESHNNAVKYASDATWEIHFDYSNANRARFMQSNAAKVFLMFRSYSQHMTYFMLRNLHQSMKGDTKADRSEAKNKLFGVLIMTWLAAGVQGLPLVQLISDISRIFHSDEDDPWEAMTEFRRFLAEFGFAGKVVDRGVVNATVGIDMSTRVSQNDLWMRSSNRELEGRKQYYYLLEQMAGPVLGIGGSGFTGIEHITNGRYLKGIQAMTPKFIRDYLKAWSLSQEGVTNYKGKSILPREDLELGDIFSQAIGFTPDKVRIQYEETNARKGYIYDDIADERSSLVESAAITIERHGAKSEEMKDIFNKIRKFNKGKGRTNRIDRKTIKRSLAARRRNEAAGLSGVTYPRAYRKMASEIQFPK